ncbi:hypothetical protein [Chryseobacterium sp. FH1]|uniref:hypothetical protein n=1 Tax=Chryseobacterium sp. FH1 TaxID=1233951 RepID=UPI0004E31653|nr:hypothetical protein [Chryseobacterium sp. FH1]KFC21650.1 hypothetical protein IO90_06730 [Chryseobacterium sp. FH1]
MKINNRKEVIFTMYGFLFLLILDLILLIFSTKFSYISDEYLYIFFALIFVFCIWRIATLKIFSMEVSEHIFSVKYRHPLLQSDHPVLELPLEKVISVKAEKGILNYILLISIRSRKGIKSFYYRLGKLPENQSIKFKEISNFIHSSRMESY